MNKTNRHSKRSLIYTILMSVMLIISIASIATLAYFTSQKSTSKEIKFGTIEVDVTSEGGNLVTTQSQNAVLMPGDTATVNFTVENKGEACYYLVLLTTPGATEIDLGFPTGLYAGAVDNAGTNKIATPSATSYQVGSFAASTENSGKSFTYENEEMTFDLVATGNEMQGKSVNICVTVVAIQQANMGANGTLTAEQYAYQELYKMLYPTEAVVVDGVRYFYDSDNDVFKVGNGASQPYSGNQAFFIGGGVADESQTEFVIVNNILGRAVTEITAYAFAELGPDDINSFPFVVTSVVIPEGITSIAAGAFSENITGALHLPSTLENVGHMTFSGSSNLTGVYFNSIPVSVLQQTGPNDYTGMFGQDVPSTLYIKEGLVPTENFISGYLLDQYSIVGTENYNGTTYVKYTKNA